MEIEAQIHDGIVASMFRRYSMLVVFLCLLFLPPALAWGPHPEITLAALATLPQDHPLRRRLGPDTAQLASYCWMADWQNTFQRIDNRWFYADDYLLYPGFGQHVQHICPSVEKTYGPYFRRALLALRTESSWNAARWVGSLLHFVEDTASPPHAAGVLGPIHSKMENWVVAADIQLNGYQPVLLGATDAEAVAALEKRMQGVIAFSKQVFAAAEASVKANNRKATEPIVLRSALEAARVVADVLHTLGTLAEQPSGDGYDLIGQIEGFPRFAPIGPGLKIMLLGTDYSTLAENDGRFVWHHLPAGNYTLQLVGLGIEPVVKKITLPPSNQDPLSIKVQAGSWFRWSGSDLHWISATQPDGWTVRKGQLESEWIPWPKGHGFRLSMTAPGSPEFKVQAVAAASTSYGVPTSVIGVIDQPSLSVDLAATERFECLKLVISGLKKPGSPLPPVRLEIAP
jgi:hypothetical protein